MIRPALFVCVALLACSSPPTVPMRAGGTLHVLSGDGQGTTAGYLLADTIVVRLVDDEAAPIPFAPIHASAAAVLSGVTVVDALTRADGTARLVWRLGLTVGEQRLLVTTGADLSVEPLEVRAEARSQPLRALAGDESVLCAIDVAGQLGCWLPLQDADHAPRWSPHITSERFVSLAIHRLLEGARRGCAAAVSGSVWCFDVSDDGSVNNLAQLTGAPAAVVQVTTGSGDLTSDPPFCGLTSEGGAVCWGGNAWGVLGDGSEMSRQTVAAVLGPHRFSQLAIGPYHGCGADTDGVGWCWGRNDSSQVGTWPSPIPQTVPIRRTGTVRFQAMVPVPGHATCGVVRQNGGIYCWGATESTGIGEVTMNLLDAPSFSFPIFAAGAGRDNTVSGVDGATVVLGSDGESSWWGRLEPGVEQVRAYGPRPFIHQLPLATLTTNHLGGLLCGTMQGSGAYLCGRMMTLTGYPTHQTHPEFSGFGMPQP